MGAYDVQNQAISAIPVIPSNTINIPAPGIKSSGSVSAGLGIPNMTDGVTGTFLTDGVQKGDIIYNTTATTIAIIMEVTSETVLVLDTAIMTVGATYEIYNGNQDNSTGLLLYVGTTGDISVTTTQNNTVTLVNIGNASFIPLSVRRVNTLGTTASDIIALL
jgi:hypothetical protein